MDKTVINKEQFRKLVISEAKKFIAEEGELPISENSIIQKSKREVTFDKVESLIKEMEQMPKSIISLTFDKEVSKNSSDIIEEVSKKPNRDLDVVEHNSKKNIIHVNEGEKDKWNRMLNYKIPSDEER